MSELSSSSSPPPPFFAGKVLLITGAGGSFGSAGVSYFLSLGCLVIGWDVSLSAMSSALSSFAACPRLVLQAVDVTSEASVQGALAEISSKHPSFAPVELLWNNAGYQGAITPTLSYPVSDFSLVMNVNVTGMFIVLKEVSLVMSRNDGGKGRGSIVNTASVAGIRCTPAMVAYASSKAAVLAMTVCTSKDLARNNIRVNAVSPALIGPGPMWDRQNEMHAASGSEYFARDKDKVAADKINGVPMKRVGTVDEVLKAVKFLLSDEASYTTGSNLVVDGGLSGGMKC